MPLDPDVRDALPQDVRELVAEATALQGQHGEDGNAARTGKGGGDEFVVPRLPQHVLSRGPWDIRGTPALETVVIPCRDDRQERVRVLHTHTAPFTLSQRSGKNCHKSGTLPRLTLSDNSFQPS